MSEPRPNFLGDHILTSSSEFLSLDWPGSHCQERGVAGLKHDSGSSSPRKKAVQAIDQSASLWG